MCLLGPRLLSYVNNCTREVGGDLWNIYCKMENGTVSMDTADCDEYFLAHNVSVRKSIVGLASGVFIGKVLFKIKKKSLV